MITLDSIPVSDHELTMDSSWDTHTVRALVDSKSRIGDHPAYLVLGQKEAALLKRHLAAAFGEESVSTLKDTYYLGMAVTVLEDCESYFATIGHKCVNRGALYQTSPDGKPKREDGSGWQFTAA